MCWHCVPACEAAIELDSCKRPCHLLPVLNRESPHRPRRLPALALCTEGFWKNTHTKEIMPLLRPACANPHRQCVESVGHSSFPIALPASTANTWTMPATRGCSVKMLTKYCNGRYDLDSTTWSPAGRVFQIEYAGKAVDNSGYLVPTLGRPFLLYAWLIRTVVFAKNCDCSSREGRCGVCCGVRSHIKTARERTVPSDLQH